MGQRNNLLVGRVSGALALCRVLREDQTNSKRVRRWAKWSHYFLDKLQAAMKDQVNGV